MATDEQIERVRTVQKHYVLNDETVEAFDAVLAELTALRKLADAVEGARDRYINHDGSPPESADFVFDELDAALAEARK